MRRSTSILSKSSMLFLPFRTDQGYGDATVDARGTVERTVIQTSLPTVLNQYAFFRTLPWLYDLTLSRDRSRNGKCK